VIIEKGDWNMFKLGFIGFGFVNSAVSYGFSTYSKQQKIYDKYKEGYDSLEETVNDSDFLFVAVPTPMNDDGDQYVGDLYDAVDSINSVAETSKIIIIKSTVLPGTTRKLSEKYPNHKFVFNPEFLTERTAKLEFINPSRIILGGPYEPVKEVEILYRIRFPEYIPLFKTTWEGAELVKYMTNCYFAMKITFLNEIYDMAKHLNTSFDDVVGMWLSDSRFGNSHTQVPGHDESRGYGGKCFTKDVRALYNWAESQGLHADMCRATDAVNNRIRTNKDWEKIKGATSKNNYGK